MLSRILVRPLLFVFAICVIKFWIWVYPHVRIYIEEGGRFLALIAMGLSVWAVLFGINYIIEWRERRL